MDDKEAVEWLSGHHNDLMKISMVKNTPYGKIADIIQSMQADNLELFEKIQRLLKSREIERSNTQEYKKIAQGNADKYFEEHDKAVRLQAENERLRGQVEKMKNCGNCKWFQEEGECVNPKNTEQDCEYYRGFFWEAEDLKMDHCKECHAVKELVDYRDKLQSEVERLNLVSNERIADINAVLDDNESHRAMKLATDLAFMEQRKQIEKYRQALNRALGFIVDCPSHQGLTDGVRPCAEEYEAGQCSKCWKIALGVEEE